MPRIFRLFKIINSGSCLYRGKIIGRLIPSFQKTRWSPSSRLKIQPEASKNFSNSFQWMEPKCGMLGKHWNAHSYGVRRDNLGRTPLFLYFFPTEVRENFIGSTSFYDFLEKYFCGLPKHPLSVFKRLSNGGKVERRRIRHKVPTLLHYYERQFVRKGVHNPIVAQRLLSACSTACACGL